MDLNFVLNVARKSECIRRKYGAIIVGESDELLTYGYNQRVTRCCDDACMRNRIGIHHGLSTEVGAEIHAEQAALINYNPEVKAKTMYLAGLDSKGELLVGFDNRPCYSCARMIVYAGFTWIYLPIEGDWQPVNIHDVIENWERYWEPEN